MEQWQWKHDSCQTKILDPFYASAFTIFVDMCKQDSLRQLFLSRCSIPVTQLQTGPPVLLVQICSHPPLSSPHQSDSYWHFEIDAITSPSLLSLGEITPSNRPQLLRPSLKLTSSSYGSNGQYLIPKLAVFWVHPALVWTVLCTNSA